MNENKIILHYFALNILLNNIHKNLHSMEKIIWFII